MKWTYGAAVLCASLTLGSMTVARATSQGVAEPEKGEVIVSQSCISCHDLRPIQMQARNKESWSEMVDKMVQYGAAVKKEDVPVLLDYLVQHHGPLPEGEGKAIVLNICTMCHDLDRVRQHYGSEEEWEELLNHMIGEGAPLSDEEFPIILHYLGTNFRPPQ